MKTFLIAKIISDLHVTCQSTAHSRLSLQHTDAHNVFSYHDNSIYFCTTGDGQFPILCQQNSWGFPITIQFLSTNDANGNKTTLLWQMAQNKSFRQRQVQTERNKIIGTWILARQRNFMWRNVKRIKFSGGIKPLTLSFAETVSNLNK